MRRLQSVAVERNGEIIEITVQANAFLHHMVRNIAGSLILVGAGERPAEWLPDTLAARDRTRAGPTAPPQGLYFAGVEYDDEFGLPCLARPSGRLLAASLGETP
jgi:tRNA pseudouridine38-40 synthase